jgi:hypothetical protein
LAKLSDKMLNEANDYHAYVTGALMKGMFLPSRHEGLPSRGARKKRMRTMVVRILVDQLNRRIGCPVGQA